MNGIELSALNDGPKYSENGHGNSQEDTTKHLYNDHHNEDEQNGTRHNGNLKPLYGDSHRTGSRNDDEDEDEEFSDSGHGDDEEALLSGRPGHEQFLRARTERERERDGGDRTWPQIKNIVLESAPTLLFTTIGLLFTGELLDHVSRWRAMREVDQLIMIIPVILNLKGNLEMNLSARLGTAANVGELDEPYTRRALILGNLSLLQVQATVVSFVAACVSFILGFIVPRMPAAPPETEGSETAQVLARELIQHFTRRPRPTLPPVDTTRKLGIHTFVMVASTAMSAACLSSLILGSFMCGLIVVCRRFGRDPDNIAPPIASCLGDLVTLILIGIVSTLLIPFLISFIPFFVIIFVLFSFFSCIVLTHRNPFVKDLMKQGWSPLFGAMIISCTTGIVLDLFVSRYEGFALLAVVISGLPGSVGSIFISRLSTSLHAVALSAAPSGGSFLSSLNKKAPAEPSPKIVMLTLLLITLPVEVIFLSVLHALGWLHPPIIFIVFSLLFFCCAVTASLFIARSLTNFLWSRKLDPDMYAMPIHSALMDLIGQLLLVLCFEIVTTLGFAPTATHS